MTATVDRVVDTTGDERERIEIEIGGTIERGPQDPPIEVPLEPSREGPNTFTLDLATWEPVAGAGTLGIPATGVMTLVARSADGSPLSGPVQVSVSTWYPVVVNGPPWNEELTPEAPEMSFAILPTRSCHDPDQGELGRLDGRCTVPFDVYVQTPAETTGPVVVEWTVRVQAIEADGLTLGAGDLQWVRGR
jgi:hypothetical protein